MGATVEFYLPLCDREFTPKDALPTSLSLMTGCLKRMQALGFVAVTVKSSRLFLPVAQQGGEFPNA